MLVRLTPLALAAAAAALLAGCAAPGLKDGPKNLAPATFAQLPPANPGAALMTTAFVDSAQLQRVVDDLDAMIAFFAELGMEIEGRATVEGEIVDRLIGLDGVILLAYVIALGLAFAWIAWALE